MGGAESGARVRGSEELLGNGPEGGTVDGEIKRYRGFASRVKGSGRDEAWRVFGVDW